MNTVNKDEILRITDGGRLIYESIFKNLKRKGNRFAKICNPYRGDKNPSLDIEYKEKYKKWYHKDWGDPSFAGDCFSLIEQIHDVNFFHALQIIVNESGIEGLQQFKQVEEKPRMTLNQPLSENTAGIAQKKIMFEDGSGIVVREDIDLVHDYEEEFMKKFGHDYYTYKLLNVRFVDEIIRIGGDGQPYSIYRGLNKVILAYCFDRSAKIYQPHDSKYKFSYIGVTEQDYFFTVNESIIEKLQFKGQKEGEEFFLSGDIFLITAGEKDALTAFGLGYLSGNFNSESYYSEKIINQLKEKYKYVCCIYDIDDTGIKQAKFLEDNFGIISIELPQALKSKGGKDLSDYVALGMDIDELHSLIDDTIKGKTPKSPKSPVSPSDANKENQDSSFDNELLEEDDIICNKWFVNQLPSCLSNCLRTYNDRESDLILISIITIASGCLNELRVNYRKDEHSAHLYSLIGAPAAIGKSVIKKAKVIGQVIEKHQFAQYKHAIEIYDYWSKKDTKAAKNGASTLTELRSKLKSQDRRLNMKELDKPIKKTLFIPGNASSAALYGRMHKNSGNGIIFETEADTVVEALGQEWGNFSDGKRKAFHHESISVLRKDDDECFTIEKPRLAFLLSGTPNQIVSLIKDAENGLFSRYLHYLFKEYSELEDPFEHSDCTPIDGAFNELANVVFGAHIALKANKKTVDFKFTKEQRVQFMKLLRDREKHIIDNYGIDIIGSNRRMGLIFTRIAMVLQTLIESEKGPLIKTLYCDDRTFKLTQHMIKVLYVHQNRAIELLRTKKLELKLTVVERQILDALPNNFTRSQFVQAAQTSSINSKHTCDKYIKRLRGKGVIRKVLHANYEKLN